MKTVLKLANDQQELRYQLVVNSIPHSIRWEGLKKENLIPCAGDCRGKFQLFLPYSNAVSGAT